MITESHRTLHRYLIQEFLRIFALSLISLILIYAVVLFFEKMDTFIKNQAPFHLIFEYLAYKIPELTFQWTLPYAVLLSTLLTLGTFSRHSEITAMKAGGVSLYRITLPLFFIALITSFFSFLGNEYLVPLTNQRTNYLLDVKVRKEQPSSSFKNFKIWYHSEQRIYNIQLLDPETKVLKGFTLFQFDAGFRCIQRIDAREVRWRGDQWRFVDGVERNFGANGSVQVLPFKEKVFHLKEDWDSFQNIELKSREMSYGELRQYIDRIRSAGYDATRYLVDLHSKLAYPFLNLIMVFIGIPFALKTGRSGGIALSIGISVMIGFVYGVTFYVFLAFGKSGILPPLLAAWTPTVVFGLLGVFTLISLRQ